MADLASVSGTPCYCTYIHVHMCVHKFKITHINIAIVITFSIQHLGYVQVLLCDLKGKVEVVNVIALRVVNNRWKE